MDGNANGYSDADANIYFNIDPHTNSNANPYLHTHADIKADHSPNARARRYTHGCKRGDAGLGTSRLLPNG